MNIILTPAIPGGYQYRQSPNKNLDELTYLNRLTDDIILRLRESVKDTPFITITKLAGPMDQILSQLQTLTRTIPPTSNCLIAVGLNSTRMDGRYQAGKGWRVSSNPESRSDPRHAGVPGRLSHRTGHRRHGNPWPSSNLQPGHSNQPGTPQPNAHSDRHSNPCSPHLEPISG